MNLNLSSTSQFTCAYRNLNNSRDLVAIAITTVTNALAFTAMVFTTKFFINKAILEYQRGTKRNESWLVFTFYERPRIIQHNIVPMTTVHHTHQLASVYPHISLSAKGSPDLSVHSAEITLAAELKSSTRSKSTAVFNEVEIVDCLHGRASSEAEKRECDPGGIFFITDEDIRERRGIDALNYLLFLRHTIYFLAVVAFLCTFIIMPINFAGGDTKSSDLFLRLTIENVPPGSTYFWAHIVVANSFLPIGIAIMLHNFAAFVLNQERFASRTLFIQKKKGHRSKLAREDVAALIKEITTKELVIEGIQFVYDIRRMRLDKNDFVSNFNAERFCLDYLDDYNESFELRPYFLGQWLGLLGLGCFFPKTYGLTFYRKRKWEAIRNLIRDYSRVINRAQEAFFITLKTETMAKNIYNQINCPNYYLFCCRNFNICWPFTKPLEVESWKASFAPDPMDINWEALVVKKKGMWIKSCWVNLILFIIFFFCTTPSFITPYISNFSELEQTFTELQKKYENELEPISFLVQYFKPLILLLVASMLPNVVFYFSSLVPDPLKSEQTHSVMWRTYCFMVLMIIIIPSLGQSSFHEVVCAIVSKRTFQWFCLFHSYEYSFFVIYVIQSAFIGNGLELLKLSRIISYFFVKMFRTSSAAEVDHEINQIDLEFNLGLKYSRILFMVTMILLYSVSCPLITIVGLIFMVLKYYVDRHSLFHSCYPSSVSCKTYRRVTIMFFSTIVMMQFHLFTIIYTKSAPSNALTFDLIILLISLLMLPFLTYLVPSIKSADMSKVIERTFGKRLSRTLNSFHTERKKADPEKPGEQPNWCCCCYLPDIVKQLGKSKFKPQPMDDDSEMTSLDTRD